MNKLTATKASEWHSRGNRSMVLNNLDDAVMQFSRAVYLQPEEAAYHASRGDAYLRLCDFQSALLNYRKAFRLNPNDFQIRKRTAHIHYCLGKMQLKEGNMEDSSLSFAEAVALVPHEPVFWIHRIKAFIASHDYNKALFELSNIIDSPLTNPFMVETPGGKAVKILVRMNKGMITNVDAGSESENKDQFDLNGTINASSVARDDLLANKALAYAAEENGGKDKKMSEDMALDAIIMRAKIYMYVKNLDLAQQDVTWVSLLDPINTEIGSIQEQLSEKGSMILSKAQARFMVEDYENAFKDVQAALELNPSSPKIFMMRAKISRRIGKFDSALTDLKTALALCLQVKAGHQRMMEHQQSIINGGGLKQPGNAISALSQDFGNENPYGESPPDTPKRKEALDRLNAKAQIGWSKWNEEDDLLKDDIQRQLASTFNDLAMQYMSNSKLPNAVTCLNKAIELDNSVGAFFLNRGDCHRNMGELGHAMSDYHQGAKLDPKNPDVKVRFSVIHNEIGRLLYNKCKYEDAESEFSRAITFSSNVSSFFASRGRSRYRLNKWAPAYSDFVRAVELDPRDSSSREQALLLRSNIFKQSDLALIPPLPPIPAVTGPFNARHLGR